jgi:hypothetical protein
MRRYLKMVVLVGLVWGLVPTWALAAGTLTGHVQNAANSLPIPGAIVSFSPGGLTATTDASGFYTMSLQAGMYSVTATATDFRAGSATTFATVIDGFTTTVDVALVREVLTPAVYDSVTFRVPTCIQPGQAGCDSGTLLVGRDTITGGAEPNQPNTLFSSCADGTNGTFHVDPSLDRLRVYTLDGGPLAFGKMVFVEATVWASSSDRLDLWAASDPSQQNWSYLTTLTPPAGTGIHTLFATYQLPAGSSRQALRGGLRRGGSPSTCSTGALDDHDDLVFSVVGNSMPSSDFDGDNVTDLPVYRPSTGTWLIRQSRGGYATSTSVTWGVSGDLPVPGDYDGDGKADIALYRPSTGVWYILQSKTNFTTSVFMTWGGGGFLPAPGDYDGDGVTDPTVYSPSSGTWFVLSSRSGFTTSFSYTLGSTVSGSNTDVPVPGDYDGDGITDMAIYRPLNGVWYILASTFNFTLVRYTLGLGGDVPVPGDYDGDGQTDLAVYRPSTGNWIVRFSNYVSPGDTYHTSISRLWGGSSGDTPVPGDYDGDGKTDMAIFRPSSGAWFILTSSTNFTTSLSYSWGTNGDIPIPNVVTTAAAARNTLTVSTLANLSRGSDFDRERDGQSDMSVFRPSTNALLTLVSRGGYVTSQTSGSAANPTDIPVPGNYLGWGINDFAAFYRPSDGTWYNTGIPNTQWGVSTDTPVPGDYDGDGAMDIAVYRPSTGTWFILQSKANFTTSVARQWGASGDIPVPGDYDGDGLTDIAVYRPSSGTWFILKSSTNSALIVQWGANGDITVPGDYDGDGKTDIAVYRPAGGNWFILKSSTSFSTSNIVQFGSPGDVPVPGEFDGDGKTDIAIFRPGNATWYVLQSSANFTVFFSRQFGLSTDIPILRRQ